MTKILIVEDEKHIAEGLKINLTLLGHQVVHAANGIEGLKAWRSENPDLIVLDIMMPALDGYGVLQEIRGEDKKIPILILSAKDEAKDKIKAFKKGVDDYLAKPFNLDEFLLRVDRLLTQSSWYSEKAPGGILEGTKLEKFQFGANTIFFDLLKAETASGGIELTSQEVKVLRLFVGNPKIPLSRKDLLEFGWGYSQETSTRTVDNFLVRFRKYFEEDPKDPKFFISQRSVGYVFEPGSE
ncbi:MAG: response regulator transcription factor [Halobacteriovoraceae bacterium]|jgi:two-component system, OmpR family, alkaline phosphatase synthesis response regulator PhoP|nr:response regulator transcription factor [Halobacteriovoraceae bacterium]MBT5095155.1 response regulator transcription factor [Halobacteriovoraceae bacterium]